MNEGLLHLQEHQLDYDWRFTKGTIARLTDLSRGGERVLLAGCPTLAFALDKLGRRGQLIERNPNYISVGSNFDVVHADLRFHSPLPTDADQYDRSFIDPPWYPQELLRWINFVLPRVRTGGEIYFTLWPESVRPSARDEHRQIFNSLSAIGRLDLLGSVVYELPLFEKRSSEASGHQLCERAGMLFRLTKTSSELVDVAPFVRSGLEWLRFTLTGEQLAILIGSKLSVAAGAGLFEVEPFILSNTSRRNAQLETINIWTSKNGVARLTKPAEFATLISNRDAVALEALQDMMGMSIEVDNINWGKEWRHPA